MRFPDIKKWLEKALDVLPLILTIWKLFEKRQDDKDE